jgi:hypothetical protein
MKTIFNKSVLALAFLAVACTEDAVKPVVPAAENWVAAALTNNSSEDLVEFTSETAPEEYDQFSWWAAKYGVDVSTKYVIQIDNDEDFSSPKDLLTVEGSGPGQRSVAVTVEKFNATVLSLGVAGFTEATIYIRIKSSINGIDNDPLYSNAISRLIKTYQDSECGDYCTIGLIGAFTGWGNDVDLRLSDPAKVDKSSWTVTLYLPVGDVKFRAGDAWTDNWGGGGFPSGTAVKNTPDNITVNTAGYYKVNFNDVTREFSFNLLSPSTYTTVGILGDGAGGWNTDMDLTQDPNDPHVWTGTFTLTAAGVKFRADDAWGSNWGGSTYPSGVGVGNGPNIPVATGGTYFVWFNDVTGDYFFGPSANSAPYGAVGLIGPTTGLGDTWGTDVNLIQDPSNDYRWSAVLNILDGEGKFRADDGWTINWGAGTFPNGIGVQNAGNFPAKEGTYFVTFNSLTGEYYFLR